MVFEVGDAAPDREIDVDVKELAAEVGAEFFQGEVRDVPGLEGGVEREHGTEVVEDGLHQGFVAREGASTSVDLGIFRPLEVGVHGLGDGVVRLDTGGGFQGVEDGELIEAGVGEGVGAHFLDQLPGGLLGFAEVAATQCLGRVLVGGFELQGVVGFKELDDFG